MLYDDKINGQSTKTYSDGLKYVGEFKDGNSNFTLDDLDILMHKNWDERY